MLQGTVEKIVRTKVGTIRVWVSVDVHGIEEIACKDYTSPKELPKGLCAGIECKVQGLEYHGTCGPGLGTGNGERQYKFNTLYLN